MPEMFTHYIFIFNHKMTLIGGCTKGKKPYHTHNALIILDPLIFQIKLYLGRGMPSFIYLNNSDFRLPDNIIYKATLAMH